MADCLRQVEEERECINDEILVQQVRLQQITDNISMTTGLASTSDSIQVPPAFYLRSMHNELQSIQPRVAEQPQAHSMFSLILTCWMFAAKHLRNPPSPPSLYYPHAPRIRSYQFPYNHHDARFPATGAPLRLSRSRQIMVRAVPLHPSGGVHRLSVLDFCADGPQSSRSVPTFHF
jgi:hypothetical protein